MPIRRNRNDVHNINQSLESEDILNLFIVAGSGSWDVNIKGKLNASLGLYELHGSSATFGVGFEMLNNIKNYFRLYLGEKNKPSPTLWLWYKGLSCEEKKTVMVIDKERTENDR
jgi:hypothetical protein